MIFGSFFTLMFIMVFVSIVLGLARGSQSSLSGRYDDPYPPLDPRRHPQLGPGPNPQFYGPQLLGYGQQARYPQGYDPSAMQPVSPASLDAVNSDITTYGEQLRDLDLDVVGRTLDAAAQSDYSKALDAYDGAKQLADRARSNADVKRIAQILEDGRYRIAVVKARANNQPIPEHRPPCFFDPAHGTSVANVQWTPPGGVTREVPACDADARRVLSGLDPSIRMVRQPAHSLPVPYWEDPRHAAWAQGYYGRYGADPALRQITTGALMIGGFSLLMGLLDE